MEKYKYPVRETVNGITFIFNGPEMDPISEDPHNSKDKDGRVEEYFLWKDQDDTPATHSVWILGEPSGNKLLLITRRTDEDKWEYDIRMNKQMYKRRRIDGEWSPEASVTALRIRLASETESAAIDQIKPVGNGARIEHKGSDCSLTWNQATRRYVRKCR